MMLARIVFLSTTITVALIGAANAASEAAEVFTGLGIMLWVIYFIPSIIALARRHRNIVPIIVLNFFLGWTILGWIVALIWSFTADVEQRRLLSAPSGYGPSQGWQGYQTQSSQGYQDPPSDSALKEYRGYQYFVEDEGRAHVWVSSGKLRNYPSEEMAKRDVDRLIGSGSGG